MVGAKRKELIPGVDEDIKRAFFNLDVKEKQKIFLHYKREYGQEARDYAEKTYKKWKSGEVRMSGMVADRLLAILPYYLGFDEKFSLIQRIWQERTHSHVRIVIDVREGITTTMRRILDAIDFVEVDVVPEAFRTRLKWLNSSDFAVAEQILVRLYTEEREARIQTLRRELGRVVGLISTARRSSVRSAHQFNVPGGTVEIIADEAQRPGKFGGFRMSNDENQSGDSQGDGQLVPTGQGGSQDLAPIKDAESLLNQALQHVSPEKKQEIVDKAAEEVLRLQTKRAEAGIDDEIVDNRLDAAGRVARQIESSPNTDYQYNTEVSSQHGTTKIDVKSKQGSCFVATACFGDYDHPTVKLLREFRDKVLLSSAAGRGFVTLYYRFGPHAAAAVNRLPSLKPTLRALLGVFARAISGLVR